MLTNLSAGNSCGNNGGPQASRRLPSWVKDEVCCYHGFGYQLLTLLLGIYGPGYKERRAERIKEAYGVDVTNNTPAS